MPEKRKMFTARITQGEDAALKQMAHSNGRTKTAEFRQMIQSRAKRRGLTVEVQQCPKA